MGLRRSSLALVAAVCLAPTAVGQGAIDAPSSAPMIDVLRDTFDAPDARTRLESVRWLRSRTTPAAFQVLRRATRDPVPAIAFEGLMGLAEIAPEYELDGYQMRHLDAPARARLIRLASEQGLMSPASLRAIATDSGAEAIERAEALLALGAMGQEPQPSLWLPILGASDERVRLLAALSVITDAPGIRAVAVAQEHAVSIVRASVRDASAGRTDAVLDVLGDTRLAPTQATADWCLALLAACENAGTPDALRVTDEALRTLLIADPGRRGARERWLVLCGTADASRASELAIWALETAAALDARGARIPRWLSQRPEHAGRESLAFAQGVSRAIDAMRTADRSYADELVGVVVAGGPEGRALGVRLVLGLPEPERSRAIVSVLQRPETRAFEPEMAHLLARHLARADPIAAQVLLESSGEDSAPARWLALEGVWSRVARRDGSALELARAVHLAEREIEGARTAWRSALAAQMEFVAAGHDGFHGPLRAEAAWLALVLRDQVSEAMAHLPRLSPVYDADLSLELEHADRLLQWVQMPYP